MDFRPIGAREVQRRTTMKWTLGNPRRVAGVAVVAVVGLATALSNDSTVQAQLKPGEFALHQSGLVGWVYVNSDRTVEWWAYIDGLYEWADSSSVGSNQWQLDAEYIGSTPWITYSAWKANVLERAAADGKTIVFQQHAVTEESVEN
jgi:hypothetical protein